MYRGGLLPRIFLAGQRSPNSFRSLARSLGPWPVATIRAPVGAALSNLDRLEPLSLSFYVKTRTHASREVDRKLRGFRRQTFVAVIVRRNVTKTVTK